MLVRHLSYFVTLASEKHFARAAELCHVAQPTLSAAIRKLEEDLGVRLVLRNPRRRPGGRRRGLTGILRLGVIPAAMPTVSFLSARFSVNHPAATIEIH